MPRQSSQSQRDGNHYIRCERFCKGYHDISYLYTLPSVGQEKFYREKGRSYDNFMQQ